MIKSSVNDWFIKNCKFASSDDPKPGYVQWMTDDNKNFFPAAEVVKAIPPGYYEPCTTLSGSLYFKRLPLGDEGLIKFPESNSDMVIDEIETFWEKEPVFRERKLAYKRGLLLYGPPGSGKTSTIKIAMKNIIKRNGLVLRFGSSHTFEAGMSVLREVQANTPVIVLMEDLDAILNRGYESEIINILDGVVPVDKVVFLATTNYPERLGARIMNRPSRFDKRIEIGMPNAESRKIYLKSLVANRISEKELNRWVADTENLSIAHLKELVTAVTILGNKYEEAIKTLGSMKAKVYSDEFKEERGINMTEAAEDPKQF